MADEPTQDRSPDIAYDMQHLLEKVGITGARDSAALVVDVAGEKYKITVERA
jgi:hypothetical protein